MRAVSRGLRRTLFVFAAVAAAFAANAAVASASLSSNWSGYVISGDGLSFTDVKGTWVEPTASCTSATTASAFWIGLGGSTTHSPGLEQTGTSADCRSGRPMYYAWFEILPAAAVDIPLRVAPGDTITAEVATDGTTFTFTLSDVTSGASFTKTATVANPAVESAEWIAEAPSVCARSCQVMPLANFGSVAFTAASATANTHSGTISDTTWTNDAIQLGSRTVVAAAPSTLSEDGTSFSVAWQATGVPVPVTPPRARPRRRPRPHR
jgi:Peptidase A4 family